MDRLLLLSIVVVGLVIMGAIACLPLYKWDIKKFLRTTLAVKILFWIPLYAVFLLTILGGPFVGVCLSAVIFVTALFEFRRATIRNALPTIAPFYLGFFCLATVAMAIVYIVVPPHLYVGLLTVVYLGSVLSDVVAFFLGNYIKGHSLPLWINPGKNWEGVIGQLIGGVAGVILAGMIMDVTPVWWLGALIGLASAFGDLFNSIVKRRLNIKDWGQTIPGHGGVLDRCSSLSAAFLIVLITYSFSALLI